MSALAVPQSVTVIIQAPLDVFTFGDIQILNARIFQSSPGVVNHEAEWANVSTKTGLVTPLITLGASSQSGTFILGPGQTTGLIGASFVNVPISQVIITFDALNSLGTAVSNTITLSILTVGNPPSIALPSPPPTFSIGQQVMVRPDSRCGSDAGRTGSISSITDVGEPLYNVGFATGGQNSYRRSENCLVAN